MQDTLWLGPDAFRPRERVDEKDRRDEQYERAAAEDLTAEPSDAGELPASNFQPLPESPVVATSEDGASGTSTNSAPLSSAKKYSPFLTVTSKRSSNVPEKDKRRYGKRI